MAAPKVPRGMGVLLVERDMKDDEAVTSPAVGAPYALGCSSSDDGELRRESSGGIPLRVPTGTPSGGLMSVYVAP